MCQSLVGGCMVHFWVCFAALLPCMHRIPTFVLVYKTCWCTICPNTMCQLYDTKLKTELPQLLFNLSIILPEKQKRTIKVQIIFCFFILVVILNKNLSYFLNFTKTRLGRQDSTRLGRQDSTRLGRQDIHCSYDRVSYWRHHFKLAPTVKSYL